MKIDIDFVKGLVQSATGAGFAIDSKVSVAAAGALDATTFLTVATGAIAGNGLVLPASANTTLAADETLTNIGDWILAVYDGSAWVCIRSKS